MAGDTSTRGINAVRRQPQPVRQSSQQCPAFNHIFHLCKKVGHVARVCKGGRAPPAKFNNHPAPHAAMAVHVEPPLEEEVPPNINASIVSDLPAFECSGTFVSERTGLSTGLARFWGGHFWCREGFLSHLHEHPDNLLPSNVTPRAVNGSLMRPIGWPVTITLGNAVYAENFHIYPDVSTTLLSWRAARV